MFCKQCGTELKNGTVFCTNCGAKQVVNVPRSEIEEENLEKTVGVFNEIPTADTPQPDSVTPRSETPPQYTPPIQPTTSQYSQQVNYQNNQQQFVPGSGASNGHVSFGKAIALYFKNYVNFTGRASRSEFWWAILFAALVMVAASIITVVGPLVILGLLLPSLSVAIRRLHDIGKAWYWYLMGLIPLAGFIIMIVFYCTDSDGNNQWGPAVAPNGIPYNQQYRQQPGQQPYAPTQPAQLQYAQQQISQPVQQQYTQQSPAKAQITDQDIVAMAQQHAPFNLGSSEAKHIMDNAISKIVPTYSGVENLATAMMLCNPDEIKDKIKATDTDTLIVIFKALGYYIGIGVDQSVLGLVQQNVLTTLKTRF